MSFTEADVLTVLKLLTDSNTKKDFVAGKSAFPKIVVQNT